MEGGRGAETQKFVYQKWPDQIFPIVNLVVSHDGHFGLQGGEEGGVTPPTPLVSGPSTTSMLSPTPKRAPQTRPPPPRKPCTRGPGTSCLRLEPLHTRPTTDPRP